MLKYYCILMVILPNIIEGKKFTSDQLIYTDFPTKISTDIDLDPCKAGKILSYFYLFYFGFLFGFCRILSLILRLILFIKRFITV